MLSIKEKICPLCRYDIKVLMPTKIREIISKNDIDNVKKIKKILILI